MPPQWCSFRFKKDPSSETENRLQLAGWGKKRGDLNQTSFMIVPLKTVLGVFYNQGNLNRSNASTVKVCSRILS